MPKGTKKPKSTKQTSLPSWSVIGSEKDFHRAMSMDKSRPKNTGSTMKSPWGRGTTTTQAINRRSGAAMSGFKGPSVGRPKIPRERY